MIAIGCWSQVRRSRKQLIGNSFESLDLKQFWKIAANEVSIHKFNWKTKMLHIIGIEDKPHSQYTFMCMQVSDFIKAKLSLAMIYRQFAMPDQIHCVFRGTYGKNHLVRCHKTTNVCAYTSILYFILLDQRIFGSYFNRANNKRHSGWCWKICFSIKQISLE